MKAKVSFDYYVLLFFLVSFLGWVWEVCIYLVRDGQFVNRGILSGPWLPIYGEGQTGSSVFTAWNFCGGRGAWCGFPQYRKRDNVSGTAVRQMIHCPDIM